jgi:hypothetical protein
VEALAQELELAASQTRAQLGSESGTVSLVSVARQEGRLEVTVMVRSQVGHKLPTAYPSRRVWLELTVRDGDGDIVFRSGEFRPNGEIAGNDNDQDPERFEPHYEEIRASDQVQIYESILVNAEGRVTTGLLEAVGYGKDNRILPRGFDKATAEPDIAVHGAATGDTNFAGGSDQVVYSIDPGDAAGELRVDAVLWYQPVGFRWAENLRPYAAPEPERFVRYYSDMSEFSATVLARDSTTLR